MGEATFQRRLSAFLARVADGGGGPAPGEAAELLRQDPATGALRTVGIDPVAAADERLRLFRRSVGLCPSVPLAVAGHEVAASLTPEELWRFYLPLCQAIEARAEGRAGRTLVGIAGPPGSGKSVFAALLATVMRRAPGSDPAPAPCPMDGFHYPNAYLDSHFGLDPQGRRVPLRRLKGMACTFDAEAFLSCVRRLREGGEVTVPRYDRRLHDPVPDGIRIGAEARVMLVEGNHLLRAEAPWREVAGLLDLKLFLSVPLGLARAAIIPRHVRGGRTPEEAAAHFEHADAPNYHLIMSTAHRADLIIRRDAPGRITALGFV